MFTVTVYYFNQVAKNWSILIPSLDGLPLVHSSVKQPDKTQVGELLLVFF